MSSRYLRATRAEQNQATAEIAEELRALKSATSHEQHTTPVVGCDRCDDLLQEARELADLWEGP